MPRDCLFSGEDQYSSLCSFFSISASSLSRRATSKITS